MSDVAYQAHASAYAKADWGTQTYPLEKYGPESGKGALVDVGDGHKLWVQIDGNPDGEPVVYLHGGPGGGCQDSDTCFFDPKRYCIIRFDQRGCGHSTPTLDKDFKAAFYHNDTEHLVEDINKVREHCGIKGKMHIQGGSWGTTLGLKYAIKYPQNVKSLNMRGVFLGSDAGMKYLFQGNAATYKECDEALRQKLDETTGRIAEVTKANQENAKEAERRKTLSEEDRKALPPLVPRIYDSGTLMNQREATNDLVAHFNKQTSDIEGAYRAYMPPGGKDGQIPTEYWPEHKHMAEAYAKSWDEYVRLIPQKERGDMPKAYVARLEADVDPALKGTGKFDAKTNRIDPDYQQRVAFAFAKWEGTISNFCNMPDPITGAIDLGKFEDPNFAVIFARTEARYMVDGLYLTEDGSKSPGGSDFLTRPENLKRMADCGVVMNVAHGENDEVCPVRDAWELKKAYEAAGGPEVYMDVRPETGHSRTEIGNTKAMIDIMDNHVPKITPEERLAPATPANKLAAGGTELGPDRAAEPGDERYQGA